MKSSLAPEQVCAVILSHVERCFWVFWQSNPCQLTCLGSCYIHRKWTGLQKYIPSDKQVWDVAKCVNNETQQDMEDCLTMELGNVSIGFDGVTVLGKHAILYTFSKGAISLFPTIIQVQGVPILHAIQTLTQSVLLIFK
jgi:hypothetical protein